MPPAPPPAPDRSALLAAATQAASLAAIVTRAVQLQAQRGKIDKSDGSPVTIADFAAQAIIIRELNRRLGPVRIVGEESSGHLRDPAHESERRAAMEAARAVWPDVTESDFLDTIDLGASKLSGDDRPHAFWAIDPIDGTKGFIRGHQYSVCLALIEHGRPVVGVLGCPNLSADLDRPFTLPDPHGVTIAAAADGPVLAGPCDDPARAPEPMERAAHPAGRPMVFTESFESSHSDQTVTRQVMQALAAKGRAVGPSARIDSQCKYAVVARGQVDVFLRRPRNAERRDWIWDHAPGCLIAARAGVKVTDAHGRAVDFSQGQTLALNHGVLAAAPADHAQVLSELERLPVPAH